MFTIPICEKQMDCKDKSPVADRKNSSSDDFISNLPIPEEEFKERLLEFMVKLHEHDTENVDILAKLSKGDVFEQYLANETKKSLSIKNDDCPENTDNK